MTPLLLTLALLAAPLVPQDPGAPPDPALVEATAKEVRKALAAGATAERVAAVEQASAVVAPEVIEQIARGLRQDEAQVQLAVLRALRFMDHPDALAELEQAYEQRRELHERPELYEELVKGIAAHGSPDSVGLLIDFSLRHLTRPVMRARILGLGRVRDAAALDALFAVMDKLGSEASRPYLDDLRLALMALVGPQPGVESPDEWRRWWRAHRSGLEVAATPPELPVQAARFWRTYWERPARETASDPDDRR
jgi:hypothetical protein